jgi:hypothetical protein
MTAYRVTATLTVEATGASGEDGRAKVEATAQAGLGELPAIAARYGYTVITSDVTVESARST